MPKFIDLTGQQFGRLTVLKRVENKVHPKAHPTPCWLCKCDCGKEVTVAGEKLKSGHTQSCGCLQKERARTAKTIHGLGETRLYSIWKGMKDRCSHPSHRRYKRYGGRGITVCDEWLHDFQSFYDWAIAHGYTDELSIDRIDVNGNYEPSNCRWATAKEQVNNTSRNRYSTLAGETHTLAEWCNLHNLSYSKVSARLRSGWTIEEALEIAPRKTE